MCDSFEVNVHIRSTSSTIEMLLFYSFSFVKRQSMSCICPSTEIIAPADNIKNVCDNVCHVT